MSVRASSGVSEVRGALTARGSAGQNASPRLACAGRGLAAAPPAAAASRDGVSSSHVRRRRPPSTIPRVVVGVGTGGHGGGVASARARRSRRIHRRQACLEDDGPGSSVRDAARVLIVARRLACSDRAISSYPNGRRRTPGPKSSSQVARGGGRGGGKRWGMGGAVACAGGRRGGWVGSIHRMRMPARVRGLRVGVLRGKGGRERVTTQGMGGTHTTPLLSDPRGRARWPHGWMEGAEEDRTGGRDARRRQEGGGGRCWADRAFVVCAPCKESTMLMMPPQTNRMGVCR